LRPNKLSSQNLDELNFIQQQMSYQYRRKGTKNHTHVMTNINMHI